MFYMTNTQCFTWQTLTKQNTGTYGCEPTMPHLWNVVVVALQCAVVWIVFRIFGTHSSDGMSLFSSSSSQLMEFLARGMSPDDEYLNCLAGEGSAWDLIASYAYCAFYVWVIIVYRDDLTPVYRLWYDYIFHPAIELPTPPEKRKGVHRGSKCRVLDFVSADFDAPSVVHRRVTIVCHYDKDKKKRTSHVKCCEYHSYRS